MKLISLTIITFFFFICNISAQEKGIVRYGTVKQLNLKVGVKDEYNSELYFNSKESFFVYNKIELEGRKRKSGMYKDKNGVTIMSCVNYSKIGCNYYQNREKGTFVSRELLYNKAHIVTEKISELKWKMETETRKIGKFTCQKATTEFRGRKYIAWFTPEIPISTGPWKLQGLPGLILEAYEVDKKVQFYFKSIEYPTTKDVKIEIPTSGKKSNLKEYITIRKKAKEDADASARAFVADFTPEGNVNKTLEEELWFEIFPKKEKK